MEIGSKIAIKSLKLISPKTKEGEKQRNFYEAQVIENVYNPTKKGSKWDTISYIVDLPYREDMPIEVADFSAEVGEKTCYYTDKEGKLASYTRDYDKYSYERITNPEKSIIRVLDFKYSVSIYKKDDPFSGKSKNSYASKLIVKDYDYDKQGWMPPKKAQDIKIKIMENTINKLKRKAKEKVGTRVEIIKGLRKRIQSLEGRIKTYERFIQNQMKGKKVFGFNARTGEKNSPAATIETEYPIVFLLKDVQIPLDSIGEFYHEMKFSISSEEYEKFSCYVGYPPLIHLYVNGDYHITNKFSVSFDGINAKTLILTPLNNPLNRSKKRLMESNEEV